MDGTLPRRHGSKGGPKIRKPSTFCILGNAKAAKIHGLHYGMAEKERDIHSHWKSADPVKYNSHPLKEAIIKPYMSPACFVNLAPNDEGILPHGSGCHLGRKCSHNVVFDIIMAHIYILTMLFLLSLFFSLWFQVLLLLHFHKDLGGLC